MDPVATGDAGKIDVAAIAKSVTEEVTKQVSAQMAKALGEIQGNVKIVADTLAEQGKLLDAANKKSGGPTAEEVKALVADAIKGDREAVQKTGEQKAALEAFIKDEKNGLAKLPAEYTARLGTDPAKWADEAKGIAESWQKFLKDAGIQIPNVGGGANRDGGTPAAGQQQQQPNSKFIGDNTAKQVAAMKMPA